MLCQVRVDVSIYGQREEVTWGEFGKKMDGQDEAGENFLVAAEKSRSRRRCGLVGSYLASVPKNWVTTNRYNNSVTQHRILKYVNAG